MHAPSFVAVRSSGTTYADDDDDDSESDAVSVDALRSVCGRLAVVRRTHGVSVYWTPQAAHEPYAQWRIPAEVCPEDVRWLGWLAPLHQRSERGEQKMQLFVASQTALTNLSPANISSDQTSGVATGLHV